MSKLPPPRASSCPEQFLIAPGDPAWPDGLADLGERAPARLYAMGSAAVLGKPLVGIVGTRRATPYGLRVTRELGRAFARAGACVVSGMATGIDGMAHRAALDEGGSTVAVLGTGFDYVYPRSHRPLQREIAATGLVLTELAPGDHGQKFTFLARNRIIAAMCRTLIVVEAPLRSGALDTADKAADLGRNVGAIPGPIDQPQSAGANRLIAHGANLLGSVEEALTFAGLTPPLRTPQLDPEGDAGRVWSALAGGGLDMDALCAKSRLPAAQCMAAVTALEIQGAVECALTGVVRRR